MRLLSWLRERMFEDNRTGQNRKSRPGPRIRPLLELLEDRCLPSTLTVLNTNDSGMDSLRADIAAARSGDTIVFDPSLNGQTVTLTSGELVIDKPLDIQGPGAALLTISGNHTSRVFEIAAGTESVSLSGLTIANGTVNGFDSFDEANGGGIANFGTLTVTNTTLSGNSADFGVGAGPYSAGDGGGIANFGTLTLTNSTVSGNSATGGGSFGAGNGGGIYNYEATLTVTNTTLSGNSASGSSGGGGIESDGGFLTVTNSTLSGNSADFGRGGGIWTFGILTLTNSTLSGNSAASGGGILADDTVIIANTIVAGNTASVSGPEFYGSPVTSQGNNLIGNGDGVSGFGAAGDQVGTGTSPVNPLLAPLGNYGGPTQTMALLPGSPAIDAGASTGALTRDQRGDSRVAAVDIGAFESQGFTLSLVSGNNQTAALGAAFANPLVVQITANNPVEPVAGGTIAFTAPSTGASTNPPVSTATIAANGQASGNVTANNSGGQFQVVAGATGSNTAAFTLLNDVAPTVTVNGPTTDSEGTAATFTGSFTGGGTATGPYNFTWHVSAGNGQSIADQTGTVAAPGNVPSFTFTPADDGAYTVTLTVTDQFNLTGTQSAALTATNLAPTATITGLSQPQPLFILAGDALKFSGAFSDPGTLDGHTVTWNFGDGNSTSNSFGPGGSASFSASHAFAAPGTYVVTLTVTDDDGGGGTAQMTVIVQTPAGATGSLRSYVQSLAALNGGQQNSLLSTLDAVTASLNRDNTTAAKNQLGAFENKVKALFQAGLLTGAQEAFLLSSADAIQQGIG